MQVLHEASRLQISPAAAGEICRAGWLRTKTQRAFTITGGSRFRRADVYALLGKSGSSSFDRSRFAEAAPMFDVSSDATGLFFTKYWSKWRYAISTFLRGRAIVGAFLCPRWRKIRP